jgi:hypothetical protein
MFYLLLAVGLCLAAPWLPYLVYRRLPRRALPPPGALHLDRLASGPHPGGRAPAAAVGDSEGDPTDTDITGPPSPAAGSASAPPPNEPEQRPAGPGLGPTRQAPAPPRLTIPPYGWVNVVLVPVVIVSAFALGGGWAALFDYLGEGHARTFVPAVFVFKPFSYWLVCGLPAGLLGICCSIVPSLWLTRLLLGRSRFHEYLFWEEGRVAPHGGYMERALRGFSCLAVGVAVLCAVYVWQVMNWYARFSEDEIAIKRLLGVGEEAHPYDAVEQIVLTSQRGNGAQTRPADDLHIRFRDGRTWSTDTTFFLPPPAQRDRLLEFLARKTGKPITRARRIEDVPGW